MLLVQAGVRRHVLWKAAWKSALGLRDAGDLKWSPRSTLLYPAVCVSAGVIAGLLGLGGGLVLTPLMLELGVHPATSAASTQVGGEGHGGDERRLRLFGPLSGVARIHNAGCP
jgi:hypothetical protein